MSKSLTPKSSRSLRSSHSPSSASLPARRRRRRGRDQEQDRQASLPASTGRSIPTRPACRTGSWSCQKKRDGGRRLLGKTHANGKGKWKVIVDPLAPASTVESSSGARRHRRHDLRLPGDSSSGWRSTDSRCRPRRQTATIDIVGSVSRVVATLLVGSKPFPPSPLGGARRSIEGGVFRESDVSSTDDEAGAESR